MKKIAVLTRDCAGVNATLRAVVRTACQYQIEVLGVLKGYDGLIDGKFIPLTRGSVSGIINLGGTILKTSRSKRFLTDAGQNQSLKNIPLHLRKQMGGDTACFIRSLACFAADNHGEQIFIHSTTSSLITYSPAVQPPSITRT